MKFPVQIPESIDLNNPKTFTQETILEFYDAIKSKYGNFCGDCKHLSESGCDKGFRPRKYAMPIGPFEYAWLRKNCTSFELFSEINDEGVGKNVSAMLDSFVQQYC